MHFFVIPKCGEEISKKQQCLSCLSVFSTCSVNNVQFKFPLTVFMQRIKQ